MRNCNYVIVSSVSRRTQERENDEERMGGGEGRLRERERGRERGIKERKKKRRCKYIYFICNMCDMHTKPSWFK